VTTPYDDNEHHSYAEGCSLSSFYSLALLDLDGVIYRGHDAVPYAIESLRHASQQMSLRYVTNNPSRSCDDVAQHITHLGLPVQPSHVMTSADAVALALQQRIPASAPVLVVGSSTLQQRIYEAGYEIVHSAADHPVAVVEGWFPQIGWSDLAQAAFALEQGALYFITNRDLTLPQEQGLAPGNGSLVQTVVTASGVEPLVSAGKPEPTLYRLCCSQYSSSLDRHRVLAVGDRLDTDILAAHRGGYDSLCVLTGVTRFSDVLHASRDQRPTYVSADLRGLMTLRACLTPTYNHTDTSVEDSYGETCAHYEMTSQHITLYHGNEVRESPFTGEEMTCVCYLSWYLSDHHIAASYEGLRGVECV